MRRLLLCLVMLELCASAEARAESRVFAVGGPGPVTATAPLGDGIAWAATGRRRPYLVAHTNGSGTRTLARLAAGRVPSLGVRLQAVDGQLGVTRTEAVCLTLHDCKYRLYTYVATDLLAGVAGGALTRVGGCHDALDCARRCEGPPAPELAVGGGAFAIHDACDRRATVFEAAGATRALPDVAAVRLAGPWAAVVPVAEPAAAVLLRRSDGAEVARLPGGYGVWLQADGTFATRSLRRGARDLLRIAGPPDWTPREIGPLSPFEQPAGLAGGRLLLLGSDASGLLVTVRAVDGRVVARRSLGWVSPRAVGFDGGRLTWPEQPCAITSLVSWDLGAAAPPRVPKTCGAARVMWSRLHDRRISLRLACPGRHEQGCSGTLRLLGRGREVLAAKRVTLGPGHATRATFTVRHRLRRRVTAVFAARHGETTRRTLTLARRR